MLDFGEVEKLLLTVSIGGIAAIEDTFGHLWGIGIPFDDLNSNEREWRLRWAYCRKQILDKSHLQFRQLKPRSN